MSDDCLLVVYGSLLAEDSIVSGQSRHQHLTAALRPDIDEIWLPGRMVYVPPVAAHHIPLGAIQGFPAVVLEPMVPGRRFRGRVVRVAMGHLSVLDQEEGCVPGDDRLRDRGQGIGSLYQRAMISLPDGRRAWIYTWNGDIIGGQPRPVIDIPHGDWLRFLREEQCAVC